ncbi:transcriptional activator DEMETER-like [Durio zibethinus]|uniref:Transcriptional activator DEMETER-like n=1 Tax=Durio zibethinus TaxID=66656 RepID=A0A6P6AL28_DURZI|nr:transcriptional activator DEMETER-like [Durio zibethinus]
MNSRMNFGEEFSIPSGKEFPFTGSWMPVTPQKSIPTVSNPIQVNGQGNQSERGNWQELAGFCAGYEQDILNINGPAQNFNPVEQMGQSGQELAGFHAGFVQDILNINGPAQNFNPVEQMGQSAGHYFGSINLPGKNRMIDNIAGSSRHVLYNESTRWNNYSLENLLETGNNAAFASANRVASITSANTVLFPNLHSQKDNWRHSIPHNSMYSNQTHSTNLHFLRNNDSFLQMAEYGFPVPCKPMSNMNSPARTEVDAASHIATSFPSMPAAPDQTKKMEDKQISPVPTSAGDESLIHEKEKQEILIASNGNEVSQQNCELLQNIVDSSSAVISTTIEGKKDSERGSDQGIDLNKTPQQKPPKQRKHRPKVIVEGNKRNPKSAITKTINSKDNPSGKRKYVRRKGLIESATEHTDSTKESDPSAGTPAKRKYVRRKSLKESANEQIDSMKESGHSAGITVKGEYIHNKKQIESMTEQADCTRGSDPSAGTAGKRKYESNRGLKASATQQVDCMKETDSSAEPAPKSCRRVLNFDLENTGNEVQAEILKHLKMLEGGKSSESQATGLQNVENSGFQIKLTTQTSQQTGLALENKQPQAESSYAPFLNKMMPIGYISTQGVRAATASRLQAKDLMENLNVIARNKNMDNADLSQKIYRNGYTSTQRTIQSVSQGKNIWENTNGTKELMFERSPQSVPTVLSNSNEGRGSKRDHCHTIEYGQFCTASSISSLLPQGMFQKDEGYRNGSVNGATFQQAPKRKTIEDESCGCIYDMKYAMSHGSGLYTKGTNSVNAKQFTSLRDCGTSDPHFQSDNIARKKSGGVCKLTGDSRNVHSKAADLTYSKQHISSQLHSGMEKIGNTNRLTLVHNLATLENCNHLLPTTPEKTPILQFGLVGKTSHANVSEKKKRGTGLSRRVPPRRGKMLQEHYEYQQSTKARGPSAKQAYLILIEEIINKFKGLTLDERNSKAKAEVQNALVVYKGAGTVVPYEGFEFIKKRKSRPKVDLDPETNRIWNLLMGKEGEDVEGADKEKEKWWEEERRVFHGRVDSFIARMHLVQGDRRFSQWKGSVVDSVIGVFLTQNVSDHLSSSAFMSLAAKFPLKSSCKRDCDGDGAKTLIEEPEIYEPNPNETFKWHENLFSHPLDSQCSMTPNRSTDYQRNSDNSGIERTSFMEAYSQSLEEEVLSSQGSFDSLVIQAIGGIRSYSGSNSETEDPTTGCKFNNIHGSTLDQKENSASFEEFFNYVSGTPLFHGGSTYKQSEVTENGQKSKLERKENVKRPSSFNQGSHFRSQEVQLEAFGVSNHSLYRTLESEAQELDGLEPFGEECMSSWASTASGFNKPKQLGQSGGNIMVQYNAQPITQDMATTALNASSSEHIMHQQEVSWPGYCTKSNQLCNNHQEKRNKAFQSESTSVIMPLTADAVSKMQKSTSMSTANALKLTERPSNVERISVLNKDKDIEDREVQSDAKEPVHSSGKEHGENSILKPKRRKAQGEKNHTTDWDGLRKQAEANGWKKERSKDTMDSLDYEAMRNANVNEISNAIKERGMNNMLAERIKEFLNRLVGDHESIDLEWLRYVPPDKAKDYLLSIRGLGLKSVECVRLLTLHHLAFPVDTNVGRIAVRLGWVPLQPLPESLQLHLLELYPVLDSIQKYLWPRLCKLDQLTLYELHYQMITFGKVFCTKSKPNCNACPMRGECRHFASAFASARLALPGPEEKSVTISTVPMMSERNPVRVVNQMSLPPPEQNLLKVGSNNGNCEPIIEEPATPEPEQKEESQSDIEDAYYEDPDEIPTIKLNIEEFTANLQHYMQAKMELQEGDLSKALVALNPEAASIPTPKLKNVSRLRTEHYVYELPDTHPILKQMERREPDDPSPYLLAIWTPGETANSIQPPEQSCGSQEPGRLCNEKTCFVCSSVREANSQTVRGTILIPCRTAMRGSFPLNGTYFQVNEVFADHESSLNPVDVLREWIWNLPRRTVYFGTSVSTIFKGLSTEGIQYCFWKGFVCVRGFDQKTRAPRPLMARLHFPASKLAKTKTENKR